MGRENDVIKAALIIFVMVAIVLGVLTYIYIKENGTLAKQVKEANDRANEATSQTAAKDADIKEFKRMIGLPDSSLAEVKTKFDATMKDAGANFSQDARFYEPIIQRLMATVIEKSKDKTDISNKLAELQGKYETREHAKDAQMKEYHDVMDKAKTDLVTAVTDRDNFNKDQEAKNTSYLTVVEAVKTAALDKEKKLTADRDKTAGTLKETRVALGDVVKKLDKYDAKVPDMASGKVSWADQASRMVTINRGRLDQLPRQTKFGVFAAESGGGIKNKKGTVEVTRILDDHSAECRIVEEVNIGDPIVPGDAIYTSLWTPGQQKHYALVGTMDLDGDGHNSIGVVRSLIVQNGGVVDCEMDKDGNVVGAVTPSTRILVVGKQPEKEPFVKAWSTITSQAESYMAKKMSLDDLKSELGYKSSNVVEHFGATFSQNDRPKAPGKAPDKKKPATATDGDPN